MKKTLAIILAIAIVLSLAMIMPVGAQVVPTPYELNATNFTIDNQNNGTADTANAQFKEGNILDVGNMSSIPRLISANNLGKDFDISFNTLLSSSGTDWRFMIIVRDQDPGKASWEGRAKTSGYNIFFGNGSIGLKYADMSDLPTPVDLEKEICDGNIHTVRIKGSTQSDGVHIDLYIDDLKTPAVSAIDNSANKVDADGKITFVFHDVNGLTGTISNFNTITVDNVPDLTPSLGNVDLFQADYYRDFVKFGQGAKTDGGKISLVPISDTTLTNSRFYLDAVQAKDATYNMTMKIINAADAQGWIGMIIMRDQYPGAASWERGAAESISASSGYMVMLSSTSLVQVVYLHKNNPNGEALTNNTWDVPEDFDWNASHVWNVGVADVGGKPTITVKVDGQTKITATDERTKASMPLILTAGGFTTVIHGDNNVTKAEISALTVDLSDKSSTGASTPTTTPTTTTTPSPKTGDSSPVIYLFMVAVSLFGLLSMRKNKKDSADLD